MKKCILLILLNHPDFGNAVKSKACQCYAKVSVYGYLATMLGRMVLIKVFEYSIETFAQAT